MVSFGFPNLGRRGVKGKVFDQSLNQTLHIYCIAIHYLLCFPRVAPEREDLLAYFFNQTIIWCLP